MTLQKSIIFFIVSGVIALSVPVFAEEDTIGKKVETLLSQMTLEEKIGQMNQYSRFSEEKAALIRQGKIGSLLNVNGAENTNKIQEIAVKESRLGIPLTISWTADNIPAIADVLFGDYNPSAKLVTTFPRSVGQVPLYYNHENTGRPPAEKKTTSKYLDIPVTPLFPFGYGLSYTRFEYTNLKISSEKLLPNGIITIWADIQNTGDFEGEEVVQLYIQDKTASMIRPVKELKGFTKIHLLPGEKKTVEFTLGPKHLGFYNQYMEYVVEPGIFNIWVARNSDEGLQGNFEVINK